MSKRARLDDGYRAVSTDERDDSLDDDEADGPLITASASAPSAAPASHYVDAHQEMGPETAAALALLTAAAEAPAPASDRAARARTRSARPLCPPEVVDTLPADSPDGKPIASFVRTLYRLVEGPVEETHAKWSDAGRRVVFTNPRAFGETVCPQYFRHAEWTSFSRMLNLYGFKKVSRTSRVTSGQKSAAQVFENRYFQRDGFDELHLVVRRKRPKKPPAGPPADATREAAEREAMREAELESAKAPVAELRRRLQAAEYDNAVLRQRLAVYETKEMEAELYGRLAS